MTPEQTAQIAEIKERRAKVPDPPWFVADDYAHECGPHKDSGLALVDTGRESDWPIARLCEWPQALFIANAPTDIDILLAALEEARRETAQQMKEAIIRVVRQSPWNAHPNDIIPLLEAITLDGEDGGSDG